MRHKEAEGFPEEIEELLGFVLRHLASELKVSECPTPLEESLRIFTRAAIQADRNLHEHPTPVVDDPSLHFGDRLTFSQTVDTSAGKHDSRPTLPTVPPGVEPESEREPEPPTARRRSLTRRGGFRAPEE
jgi:hypothetical protein